MTATPNIEGLIERLRFQAQHESILPEHTLMLAAADALALSVGEQEPVAWIVHDPAEGDYLTKSLNAAAHSEHGYTALVPASALSTAIRERDEARATLKYFSDLHEQEHKHQVALTTSAEALASQARADAIEGAVRTAVLIRGNIRGATDYAKGEDDMAAKIIDAIRSTLEKDR